MGANGSSSDAQIINHSQLKRKIEMHLGTTPTRTNGTWRARSTLLSIGGLCLCPYVLLGQSLQQKTTDLGRQNSQLQDIQGQEGGRECLWNISRKGQSATFHQRVEAKSCERHCVNMCGAA